MDKRLVVKMNFRRSSRRSKGAQIPPNVENSSKPKDPTGKERQKRFRQKWKDNKELKEQNKEKCLKFRQNLAKKRQQDHGLDEELRRKERERKAKYRKKQREAKKQKSQTEQQCEQGLVQSLKKRLKLSQQQNRRMQQNERKQDQQRESKQDTENRTMSPDALRKRAQRVKEKLPDTPSKWADTVHHIIKHATPRKRVALKDKARMKKVFKRKESSVKYWKAKVSEFACSDMISRQMPNKRDVIKVGGKEIAKRHLKYTKREVFIQFKEAHTSPPFTYSYTTFRKWLPRHLRRMNLNARRVCVCMLCFNMSEKLNPISRIAASRNMEPLTIRGLYKAAVCESDKPFPSLNCIEGTCNKCANQLQEKYSGLVQMDSDKVMKYAQWKQVQENYKDTKGKQHVKKVWQQVVCSASLRELFNEICEKMKDTKGHIFRNDYQYQQHQTLAKNLPLDHAIVYMDFSQNYALTPNDEIQAAHYVKRQVTVHTMYLMRHANDSTIENPRLKKESITIISDDLKHDTTSVYAFTMKLLSHMRDNPEKVGLPSILHRITDNCGFEYKCRQAFGDQRHYEELLGVKVVYNYSEPGHGKGPHDDIGATIKHGLDMLILQNRVRLNNAYETYLAAVQHLGEVGKHAEPARAEGYSLSSRSIYYVPSNVTRNKVRLPPSDEALIQIKGTLKLRALRTVSNSEVEIANLSCSCKRCLSLEDGPCEFRSWRRTSITPIRNMTRPKYPSKKGTTTSTTDEADFQGRNDNDTMETACQAADDLTQNDRVQAVMSQSAHEEKSRQLQADKENSDLQRVAETQGLEIKDCPKDGNCFFWAVSRELERFDQHFTHNNLRKQAIKYISSKCKDDIRNFIPGSDVPKYLKRMSRSGIPADHIIMEGLTKAVKCRIEIIHPDGKTVKLGTEGPTLRLAYLPQQEHYCTVAAQKPERTLKPDAFVEVYLLTEKTNKRKNYMAQVRSVIEEDIEVSFMAQKTIRGTKGYTWPSVEDCAFVPKSQILRLIDPPQLSEKSSNRHNLFVFEE